MRPVLLIAIAFLVSLNVNGQNKKKLIENGVKEIKVYEQKLSSGFDDKYITELSQYDDKGQIIELKQTNRKGEVKRWEKYVYDDEGNCIEEKYLDKSGKVEKKILIKYQKGLKISKEYFDSENRLVRKKSYEYEYR